MGGEEVENSLISCGTIVPASGTTRGWKTTLSVRAEALAVRNWTVYSIEYVTDLAQANNASAWRCLEYLQLPASPYLWADKSTPATGQRFYRAEAFAAPTNMAFIPPGTFRMGSPTNEVGRFGNEGPQTAVTISRGFWMGRNEVTQGEYLAVMGSNPSNFTGDTNLPVETVSWYDATEYCAVLTQRERMAGRIGTNSVYRLPTEWEYGCRGGARRGSFTGMTPGTRTWLFMRGILSTALLRRIRWGRSYRTRGG